MRTIQKAYPEREIAKKRGEKTYFTGRPCKHGHMSERNTADCSCIECRQVQRDTYLREYSRRKIAEKRAAMTDEERAAYLEKGARQQRQRRLRNPEPIRALERKHGRLKRQRHPERKNAEVRRRQTAKIQRTPPWADLKGIQWFYEDCPEGYEVDHVAPLRGKNVCGLHILSNLQYLPKEENRLKGCKFNSLEYSKQEVDLWRNKQLVMK